MILKKFIFLLLIGLTVCLVVLYSMFWLPTSPKYGISGWITTDAQPAFGLLLDENDLFFVFVDMESMSRRIQRVPMVRVGPRQYEARTEFTTALLEVVDDARLLFSLSINGTSDTATWMLRRAKERPPQPPKLQNNRISQEIST